MKFFNWRLLISEDFLKTLKVKKLAQSWRLGIHSRNMKHEDFCFYTFIFSFLSHRKHHTVKGVEVIQRKVLSKWCSSQNPTPTQSFRVKPLEISYQFNQFLQWQRWRSSGLWGICSDWGVRNSLVPISYTVRNMIALRNLNLKSDHCCATRQLSKISYHLTVISLKGIYVLSCQAAP